MDSAEAEDARARRKRAFFRVRVSILLFVLLLVVYYAVRDLRSRMARNDWDRTVDVALVLVRVRGSAPVDDDAIAALRLRAPALEARLQAEMRRHAPERAVLPFKLRVFGPVEAPSPAPTPQGDGPPDLAKQALDLARWLREVDPRAGVEPKHHDTRIYLTLKRPESREHMSIEGVSEEGGRIGIVEVELDSTTVDLALFVVTHELMHTLGATDKYDASGLPRVPEGLAEPERSPLYPQSFAEIMTRSRPLSPTSGVVPESLDELAVGALTAREIGWTRGR
jgi:hypothetical protein